MPSSSPPVFYDRTQIVQWLGAGTVSRAAFFVKDVTNLKWNGHSLSGSVSSGQRRPPYQVHVNFFGEGTHTDIEGDCTCPVVIDCEHVGAVLLAGLGQRGPRTEEVRAEVVGWLEAFRQRLSAAGAKKTKTTISPQALVYALAWSSYERRYEVHFFKASRTREGNIRTVGDSWNNVEKALLKPPQFISEDDLVILRLLWMGRAHSGYGGYPLSGANGAAALERMLGTGRLYLMDANLGMTGTALRLGNPRPGKIQWQPSIGDRFKPMLQTDPPATNLIVVEPVWYVDQSVGETGLVDLPWEASRIADYLTMPPITLTEVPLVTAVLRDIAPDLPMPPVAEMTPIRVIDTEPLPVLHLDTLPVYSANFGEYGYQTEALDHATVSFEYEGFSLNVGSTSTLFKTFKGEMVQVKRRPDDEKRRLAELRKAGLEVIPGSRFHGPRTFPPSMWGFHHPDQWRDFMHETLPGLCAIGWRVDMKEDFSFNVVEIDIIDGQLHEAADGWFDLEMGIVVADRTVRLEPLLAELFQRDSRWLRGGLDSIADGEAIDLKTDRGERLRFRAERLKPLVRVLIDLFEGLGGNPLRVSRYDAGRLEALNDTGRWQFHGDDSIRQLAQRLKSGPGVGEVPIPKSLSATLRSYQHEGLNWMQFLRAHDLSGVLADDMGLGKTIQTLAHLLIEKEAHRLDRPALVVVPTSLVHNWCEEARRFAPSLRVLSLHGLERKDKFDTIPEYDLVLTTYALLWRDQAVLSKHHYHLLILDEAQWVKNANTKAALAIRALDARHRLCLTGTPLENHLGELWSLFDFLLPGFLGTQKDFAKRWRTPIERGGDTIRRDLLARRVRPFMLRRRKDDVATELPPKTLIVRSVELEGAQRDLYETVRTAMAEKVRAAIAAQGLNRSHIVVLDALLKLRQVCCDPRLVKLEKAERVKESAKLELLLSMLPELIEEGRRVLLFSQFTGMLALIATAVEQVGIDYVMLTGDTTDRVTPVRRFQEGEVPLFLISLKAGGVGLNLTAADTVIHYDPWWNPAAENQATDRAHRLGQDKPVFVYKLIAAGSIEEKIVLLQEKKAALVEGILSQDGAAAVKFSASDLDALFAPMPTVG